MRDKETPLALVRLWPKMEPDCYDQLDQCRAAKDRGEMDWPDYCLLPINAAYTYLAYSAGCTDAEAAAVCAELTACWAWRQNKVIYAFDPDLVYALAAQADDVKDTDILPAELLMHLPYFCIYIKAPGLFLDMDGFWAWMDYDTNRGGAEFRVQWVKSDFSGSFAQVLHIIPGETLQACFMDTVQTSLQHFPSPVDVSNPAEQSRDFLRALQLVLYLLAANADIEDAPGDVYIQRQSKQGGNLRIIQDKASELHVKNVGVRVGAAFRRAAETPSSNGVPNAAGGTKRPHMRRGHWHHYWTGPKMGVRELILKWTAPTSIHADKAAQDNVVIYPVRQKDIKP